MAERISQLILNGVRYIRTHPGFLFTIVLVLMLPVIFLYTAQIFINVAHENQQTLQLDRVDLLHDAFISTVTRNVQDIDFLQSEIERITELSNDISKFRIVREQGDVAIIIAALDPALINTEVVNISPYRLALLDEVSGSANPTIINGERVWQAFRAVRLSEGTTYYIFTEFNFAQTDRVLAQRIQEAYLWMFAGLGIILLLAYRHIRMIDYSYLYRTTKQTLAERDAFTNMVVHELRAPLTAIRGYASIIHEDAELDMRTREQGLNIQKSAERLLAVVNDLLDVARLQTGKVTIQKSDIDVCMIITDVLRSLNSSAAAKKIQLVHELKYDHCMVHTDPARIQQVLTNLVSNAIKYTPQGVITVVLKRLQDRVQIRVQDTGMGIAADDQKQLFAPFFRVKSESVEQITGSGLGMWITKQLVTLLDGDVAVESIEGVGTHVVVTLPLQ